MHDVGYQSIHSVHEISKRCSTLPVILLAAIVGAKRMILVARVPGEAVRAILAKARLGDSVHIASGASDVGG